jgi:hypothetical protein
MEQRYDILPMESCFTEGFMVGYNLGVMQCMDNIYKNKVMSDIDFQVISNSILIAEQLMGIGAFRQYPTVELAVKSALEIYRTTPADPNAITPSSLNEVDVNKAITSLEEFLNSHKRGDNKN